MTARHPRGQPQKHIEALIGGPNPRRATEDLQAPQTAGGGGGSDSLVRWVLAWRPSASVVVAVVV
ncbi:hypothetical protein GCM10009641_66720 [Mycobacterium cookii]|uniref:Uncharacterized protein n=1 Tax=Nocardioides furvisabuli TaxID=375542 RepID=A0ABN2WMF1_9ACTN